MNKNKYNIEEVFKSELEDFEMDLPQNLWSNVSNNLAANSSVAKAGILGSKLFTIATVATITAVVGGAIFYTSSLKNEKVSIVSQEEETKTKATYKNESQKQESLVQTIQKEESNIIEKIDPTIEKVKKAKKSGSKQFVINNTNNNSKENFVSETKAETNNTSNTKEKATISTTSATPSANTIEVTEIKPTEITATISASPIGGYAPLTVNFSHKNENVITFWEFMDGESSSQNRTSHTFEQQGTYEVELTVTNELGESSKTTKKITVLSTSSIGNIPNIFTPNNDNINDLFIVTHENIKLFNLYIYSQKGELIYETNDIEKGWNGNTQYDEEAEPGDYIFIIKASGTDGKTFEEKGVVKLAR